VIVVDSALIYALLDGRDRRHVEAAGWYKRNTEDFATTPLVLAEVDHLALTRGGASAAHAFRSDVTAGAYTVEWWPQAAIEAVDVAERYADLGLGLTDASLVALAARLGTERIATFDERHFRAVRPLDGSAAFTILPADAPPPP
jgi:predicted nucleic acid-binding protein